MEITCRLERFTYMYVSSYFQKSLYQVIITLADREKELFSLCALLIMNMGDDCFSETSEFFKCPVCYEYIHPPIPQCIEGHNMCSDCDVRLSSCPLCRSQKSSVGCILLEKVYECLFSTCKNRGCYETLPKNVLPEHQRTCLFRKVCCDLCKWKGVVTELRYHFYTDHPEEEVLNALHPRSRTFFQQDEHQYIFIRELDVERGIVKHYVESLYEEKAIEDYVVLLVNKNRVVLDTIKCEDNERPIDVLESIFSNNEALSYKPFVKK